MLHGGVNHKHNGEQNITQLFSRGIFASAHIFAQLHAAALYASNCDRFCFCVTVSLSVGDGCWTERSAPVFFGVFLFRFTPSLVTGCLCSMHHKKNNKKPCFPTHTHSTHSACPQRLVTPTRFGRLGILQPPQRYSSRSGLPFTHNLRRTPPRVHVVWLWRHAILQDSCLFCLIQLTPTDSSFVWLLSMSIVAHWSCFAFNQHSSAAWSRGVRYWKPHDDAWFRQRLHGAHCFLLPTLT